MYDVWAVWRLYDVWDVWGCMGCMGCMAIHWRGTMRERCMGAHTAQKLYALLYGRPHRPATHTPPRARTW